MELQLKPPLHLRYVQWVTSVRNMMYKSILNSVDSEEDQVVGFSEHCVDSYFSIKEGNLIPV